MPAGEDRRADWSWGDSTNPEWGGLYTERHVYRRTRTFTVTLVVGYFTTGFLGNLESHSSDSSNACTIRILDSRWPRQAAVLRRPGFGTVKICSARAGAGCGSQPDCPHAATRRVNRPAGVAGTRHDSGRPSLDGNGDTILISACGPRGSVSSAISAIREP